MLKVDMMCDMGRWPDARGRHGGCSHATWRDAPDHRIQELWQEDDECAQEVDDEIPDDEPAELILATL